MKALDRLRAAWRDPNPIVRKELLVLLRTPGYVRALFVAIVSLGILVAGIALSETDRVSSRTVDTGRVLFQVFFSLTFLFMAVMGATFGAVTLTQERESRTLEALTLSALGPRRIVTGKLAAIFLAVAFIPVALTPVLGMVFLFGGVSIAHIALAALYVLALGAVGIAFGVAVSAHAPTTRRALITAVPAVFVSAMMLGALLTTISEAWRRASPLTLRGPFFFADAYLALAVDRRYVVGLVALPAYVIGMSLWLSYAAAHAGLMDPTDDRGRPVKRWAVFALLFGVGLVAAGAWAFPLNARTARGVALMGQVLVTVLGVALVSTFAGEPLAPSARLVRHPPPVRARLFFPHTLVASMGFVVVACGVALVALPVVTYAAGLGTAPESDLLLSAAWATAYLATLAGVTGWAAAARRKPAAGRLAMVLLLLASWVLVWIVALVLELVPRGAHDGNLLVALSPVWVVVATAEQGRSYYGYSGADTALQNVGLATAVYAVAALCAAAAMAHARTAALARDEALREQLVADAAGRPGRP